MTQKGIKTDLETHDRLMFIADRLNIPLARFLRELSQYLFDLFSEYEKGANIFYDATRGKLIITTFGKSKLIVGSMPMPNRISDEVCDIAVSTVVEKEFAEREKENE